MTEQIPDSALDPGEEYRAAYAAAVKAALFGVECRAVAYAEALYVQRVSVAEARYIIQT